MAVAAHVQQQIRVYEGNDGNLYAARHTSVTVLGAQAAPVQQQRALPAPVTHRSHNVTVSYHDRYSGCNIFIFIVAVLVTLIPFSMMIIGASLYHECPGYTNIGKYMVVQGIFGMSIPIIFIMWHCGRCVECKCVFIICIPIVVFILIWSIVGYVWITNAPCKNARIYSDAIGFSAPIWLILIGIFGACCCENKDD